LARRRRGTARVSFEEFGPRERTWRNDPTPAPPRADLTKTVELVQGSWQKIVDAGVTYEAAGGILFKHIFRIAPQAKPLFTFIPAETPIDDALFEMPSVKKHGARVVKAVADAVGSLGELDVLAPKLKALGQRQRHMRYPNSGTGGSPGCARRRRASWRGSSTTRDPSS